MSLIKSRSWWGIVVLVGFAIAGRAASQEPQAVAEDEKLLKDARLAVDDKGLLAFLRGHIPSLDDEKKVEALFRQLGSDAFKERQKASMDLIALGPKIAPLLRRSLQAAAPPLEVRLRAERCIAAVENQSTAALTSAALRLFKTRKPAGACQALLDFVPFAADELVAEEVLDAALALGVVKGQIDPALEGALGNARPERRAVAAVLVGRFGAAAQRKRVIALLQDKDALVRFRAAQGLLGSGERQALPVLVETLRHSSYPLAERAEEILVQAAGTTAPKATLSADRAAQNKCHEAWKEWLQVHQAKLDLKAVDIGLPLASPTLRAREVVRQFLDSAFKPDAEKVRSLTDLPFYVAGQQVISTRQQWDEHLKKNSKPPEGTQFKMTISKIVPLPEYLATAKQSEKDILAKAPRGDVRVALVAVELNMNQNAFKLTMAFYVRVSGARARVFGIGVPDLQP